MNFNNPYGRGSVAGVALDCCIQAVNEGTLCLVIGAGASMDTFKGYTWDALITELLKRSSLSEAIPDEEVDSLNRDYLAELLIGLSPESLNSLPDLLFERIPERWPRIESYSDAAIVYLAKICILNAKAAPDREFHCVTFNYDTLLEEAIAALGHNPIAFTEKREVVFSKRTESRLLKGFPRNSPIEVRVFHPHGIAPRRVANPPVWRARKGFSVNKKTLEKYGFFPDEIILSPTSYFHLLGKNFALPTTSQFMAFRNLRCLFFGFSFADVGVRHLLSISRLGDSMSRYQGPMHVGLVDTSSAAGVHNVPEAWKNESQAASLNWRMLMLSGKGDNWRKRFLKMMLWPICTRELEEH